MCVNPIEVDPNVLENQDDATYDSTGFSTDTDSLSSSINEYIFENGRRYHAYYGADKNLHPTDEQEQDRLDIHHEIFLQLLSGDLNKAPVVKPQRVLDIGTGTGLWAIDIANKFPSAVVVGTDLSPIQPQWVPPNCKFEVDDAELDFTYKDDTFEFIHARNIAQGINNWSKLLTDIFRCTKPGGYFEHAELGVKLYSDDNTMKEGSGIKLYFEYLADALVKMGRAPLTGIVMKEHLEEAGFVDVTVIDYKQPFGPWPRDRRLKQIGAMMLLNSESGFHAYGMAAFTRVLGMTAEEATKACANGVRGARDKNSHCYNNFHVVYGRKPE